MGQRGGRYEDNMLDKIFATVQEAELLAAKTEGRVAVVVNGEEIRFVEPKENPVA
jgi:hypothetical protein